MKKIIDYQVVDHGIYHSQYFQGCGVSFTKYDHCVTGIGNSAHDALDDCLEKLTMMGYDIPESLNLEASSASNNDDVAQSYKDCNEEMPEDCEMYYYVSVRIKENA